jgi:hypothetical protein
MSLQAVFAKDGGYAENAGAIFDHLRTYFLLQRETACILAIVKPI